MDVPAVKGDALGVDRHVVEGVGAHLDTTCTLHADEARGELAHQVLARRGALDHKAPVELVDAIEGLAVVVIHAQVRDVKDDVALVVGLARDHLFLGLGIERAQLHGCARHGHGLVVGTQVSDVPHMDAHLVLAHDLERERGARRGRPRLAHGEEVAHGRLSCALRNRHEGRDHGGSQRARRAAQEGPSGEDAEFVLVLAVVLHVVVRCHGLLLAATSLGRLRFADRSHCPQVAAAYPPVAHLREVWRVPFFGRAPA